MHREEQQNGAMRSASVMKGYIFAGAAALGLASCGEFPRDAEGTLDRIRHDRVIRVGIIAPNPEAAEANRLLQRLSRASGALPKLQEGDLETLLNSLEQGQLDLVLGRLEKKTPWLRRVTVGPPLRREKAGKVEYHLAPVMQNGENAWIALVERETRDAAPEAQ
jgi:hypothetical protein